MGSCCATKSRGEFHAAFQPSTLQAVSGWRRKCWKNGQRYRLEIGEQKSGPEGEGGSKSHVVLRGTS